MGIFGNIFNDQVLDQLYDKIDVISNRISAQTQLDTSESDVSSFFDELFQQDKGELQSLLSGVTVSSDRLERYLAYEDAYRSNTLIKRVFRVYQTNLLQKNPVDGKFLAYLKTHDTIDESKFQTAKETCKTLVDYFDLLKKLKYQICPIHFLYGDCFVEVVNLNDKTKDDVFKHLTTINESVIRRSNYNQLLDLAVEALFQQNILITETDKKIILEQNEYQNMSNINYDLSNVLYYVHSPKNIIKLVTRYGTCIGYLEVINKNVNINDTIPTSTQINTLISKLSSLSGRNSNQERYNLIDKLFAHFLKKLLVKYDYTNPTELINNLDEDSFKFIRKIVYEQHPHNKGKYNSLNVRFIPVNRMVEFQTPSSEHFPYGDSIVDPLVFPSKLYLIAKIANVVLKLSRASLIRKWIIDAGPFRQHMGMIQKLRRELYNTRVTLNNLSNYKSLVNILSDFKDVYVISKEGRRPIDVEVSSHGDPTVKIADLEDARRELLLLSGVPPQYVGYDVVELREQLIQTNVIFANEIIDMQEVYNNSIQKLLDITANFIGYNESKRISDIITVKLFPPVSFIAQMIELTLGTVGNISSTFQQMQVKFDPYYFLEKYVPYIDWEDYRRKSEQYSRKDTIEKSSQQSQQQGY